jgi:hypothetical protein
MPPRKIHGLRADPKLGQRICDHVSSGLPAKTAAALEDVSETTLYRWLSDAEQTDAPAYLVAFRDGLAKAKAERTHLLVDLVMRNATGWVRTKLDKDGNTIEEVLVCDPASARWLLERTDSRFQPTSKHEHTGAGGGPMEVIHRASRDLSSELDRVAARIRKSG